MVNHIEYGITPRMYSARRVRDPKYRITKTPLRHHGNYYACGHRGPRTNNPELQVERKAEAEREREKIENICFPRVIVLRDQKSGKFIR